MLDYEDQVKEFIKANFTVSNPDVANFKKTTGELLTYLFGVFPIDCISDYQLNEIMIELGYKRYNYVLAIPFTPKEIISAWCLLSPLSVESE